MNLPATPKKTGSAANATVAVTDICDWLRHRIQRRVLVPGQRLVEAEIISQTGASRSRVREALQRLEQEGIVQIEKSRGASVRRFSLDDLRQIYSARMALEGLAAAEFAAEGAEETKTELQDLQEQLNEIESTGDHERFARLNDEWHRLIIDGADNFYVEMFVNRLRVPIYRLLFSSFYSASRILDANADHRKITQAILDGDAENAERFMRAHIREGLQALSDIDPDYYS